MSLAEDIMAIDDRKPVPFEIPEWSLTVHLKPLSTEDQLELGKSGDKFKAELMVRACFDDQGLPIFNSSQIPALMKKNVGILERVAKKTLEVSGLRDEESK